MPLPLTTTLLVIAALCVAVGGEAPGAVFAGMALINEVLRAAFTWNASTPQQAPSTYTIEPARQPPRITPHPEEQL